jgi:DNA-binding IscR family transcriptional regulator
MHAVWAEAQEKMANQLAKTSFAQLARRDAATVPRQDLHQRPFRGDEICHHDMRP